MQNRRNFLRNSLFAITGTGLARNSFSTPYTLARDKDNKFVYRTLGETGIKLPVVSMGTGNCDNPNLVREALDRGVKLQKWGSYFQA